MNEAGGHAAPLFAAAETGALAHLYRGEVYRSTVWRTRLDATTNWAVLATGVALSVSFGSDTASPLPLALVGLLVAVFLIIEARRYRFYDFWRVRTHVMELNFFGPMLLGQGVRVDNRWNEVLFEDYRSPSLHISMLEAVGRRLRRNYGWIFAIQLAAYVGKILIHPFPIVTLDEFFDRAAVGPIPGEAVMICGFLFHSTWLTIAIGTLWSRRGGRAHRRHATSDRMLALVAKGS